MKFEDLDLLKIGNEIIMSGAIFSGEGKIYLCWYPDGEPDAHYSRQSGDFLESLPMNIEEWQKFIRQTGK